MFNLNGLYFFSHFKIDLILIIIIQVFIWLFRVLFLYSFLSFYLFYLPRTLLQEYLKTERTIKNLENQPQNFSVRVYKTF